MKEKIIYIREPFYSAGKIFKWSGSSIGVGINFNLIKGDGLIRLKIGDNKTVWNIEKERVRQFCIENKSFYTVRGGVRLCVIPWSILNREGNMINAQVKMF